MPSLSTLEFLVGEALLGIARNRLMSLAAVVTAAVSLAISAGFAVSCLSVYGACRRLPQEFDMAVYVKRNVPARRVQEMEGELRKLPNVAAIRYISRDEAWREFKKTLGADISTDDVVYNPALDTFKIRVANPEASTSLQKRLSKMPEVDSVLWRQSEVRLFVALGRIVAVVGLAATALLFLASMFIIGNTIRLGIYARRREVSIMRLVGAKPWFIRLPFLMEGMILAGGGALLAALVVTGARDWLVAHTGSIQPITRFFQSGVQPWELSFLLLVTGVALGAAASGLSIRRYLREGWFEGQAR